MGFRGQPYAFDSPADAVAAMILRLASNPVPTGVACRLAEARGRVLAQPVIADRDSPPFDHSAMDGYAVRLGDVALADGPGTELPVVGECRIGRPPAQLPGGACIRIVTGAAIPPGADAVLKREDVIEHANPRGSGDVVARITIAPGVGKRMRACANIRGRAENARAGEVLLPAGTVLTAAGIGTLASVGCVRPSVRPSVRVAVITTGDELVPSDQAPDEFQIRNSNGPVLHAALGSCPWIHATIPRHSPDSPLALAGLLRSAFASADALIVTGGISMGHRDPVREAVEVLGAEIVFHGLPQRPGKPMLGAVLVHGDGPRVPLFALPGNPVSAIVTCTRIVIPVLAAIGGAAGWEAPPRVALHNPDGKTLDLWWHRLVRMRADGSAELVDARGSGDVIAGGRSDGFIEVPPHATGPGGRFSYFRWPA